MKPLRKPPAVENKTPKRRLVDTNLVVRYLVQDHEQHAKIATRFFEACDRGEFTIALLPPVLAECVFVLESFYGHERDKIAQALSTFIESPGIEIPDAEKYLNALYRYSAGNQHFIDCVVASFAAADNIPVATFDNGFKVFADVRIEIA